MRILLLLLFVGLPLGLLFAVVIYAYYVCAKYLKDNKR